MCVGYFETLKHKKYDRRCFSLLLSDNIRNKLASMSNPSKSGINLSAAFLNNIV